MAELLGVVSGGIAVASLAIQLVEVAQRVHSFWDSISDVTPKVERIKDLLLLMQVISTSIVEICNEDPQVKCGDAVFKSLDVCKTRADKLEKMIANHGLSGSLTQSKRRWSTVKLKLRERTIDKIETQLGTDITMLLLTLQPFFHHIDRHRFALLMSKVTELSASGKQLRTSANFQTNCTEKSNQDDLSSTPNSVAPAPKGLHRDSRLELSQIWSHRLSLTIDSSAMLERATSTVGLSLSHAELEFLQYYLFGVTYTSSNNRLYLDPEGSLRSNVKRRLRILFPILSFQVQISSPPWSLTSYPIVPCQSEIFKLCSDGNINAVKLYFEKNSWTSPFVVNQHGENLLHAAARYAHAELCWFLLDIGVDGSAFDDCLLTPLDHLARKICLSFGKPARVVDTIRALVERGHCQPLLPLTSNAVSFYRGPEEGFAWLFASEYGGVNLEERDSEDWTLLGDAAFNFGWWTQLDIDEPAVGWQTLYLLRAGADPHAKSSEGVLTPLDTFLRGCTAHDVDHARKWLQVVAQSGVDLHAYAKQEQDLHDGQQYLRESWDEELWRWIPTKRRVVYGYGKSSSELEIWVEDFDALGWFRGGRWDLDIFGVCSPVQSLRRWRELNKRDDSFETGTEVTISTPEKVEEHQRQCDQ